MILEYQMGTQVLDHLASSAKDSQILLNILKDFSHKGSIDVQDAGTVARFTTALCAATPNREFVVTGTQRMHERPMTSLVDALKEMGVDIVYLEKEGCLPLRLIGQKIDKKATTIHLRESSQFLSSLLLIAPSLPLPFEIKTKGKIVSRPYVDMTISLLKAYGYSVNETVKGFEIDKVEYLRNKIKTTIEGDWSAAFYFLFINELTAKNIISIDNLYLNSIQGDRHVDRLLKELGLSLFETGGQVSMKRLAVEGARVNMDFSDVPDLAQPFIAYCVARRLKGSFTGLDTLRHKETDRIEALHSELSKIGVDMQISGSSIHITNYAREETPKSPVKIETFEDHRMAMSFFLLQLVNDQIQINSPEVVNKSFPEFWSTLQSIGFTFELT